MPMKISYWEGLVWKEGNKYPHDPTLNHTLVITKGMFTTQEKSFRLDPDHSYTILRRSINKELSKPNA